MNHSLFLFPRLFLLPVALLAWTFPAVSAESLPPSSERTIVLSGPAVTEGISSPNLVADSVALGGFYSAARKKYGMIARSAIPSLGDSFNVWVRYRNTGLQMKAFVGGEWKDFPWSWHKNADGFGWRKLGPYPRAELGEAISFVAPPNTPEDGGIDALVVTSDLAWTPGSSQP